GPRLGQVGLDRVGHGLHRRAGLDLDQAAVGERERDHRHERDGLVRVEPGDGVTLQDEAERPASLRGLGPNRLRREEAGPAHKAGDDGATGLEDVAAGDGGWKRGTVHERTSSAATIGAAIAVRARYQGLALVPCPTVGVRAFSRTQDPAGPSAHSEAADWEGNAPSQRRDPAPTTAPLSRPRSP